MTDESAFVCMNVDDCERLIDESVFNVWQDKWNVCEKGRVMYGFIQNMRFVREIEMYAWYVLLTGKHERFSVHVWVGRKSEL